MAPLFSRAVLDAALAAWQRQLLSESQCRFNRLAATLQAVSCLCTGNASADACLRQVTEDAPIASGYIWYEFC